MSGQILRPHIARSGYTQYKNSQASSPSRVSVTETKKSSRPGPDPTSLTNLASRNFSPVIKNDPLICSILAQSNKFNERPSATTNPYSVRTDHSAVLDRLKSSGVSTSAYKMSTPSTQTHTYQPLYGVSTPPKLGHAKNTYNLQVNTSKNEDFQAHKRSPSLPITQIDPGYLEPMQIDNSPIVTINFNISLSHKFSLVYWL